MRFDEYDRTELLEITRKAGIRSGEVRREKRAELERRKFEIKARDEVLRGICDGIKDISGELKWMQRDQCQSLLRTAANYRQMTDRTPKPAVKAGASRAKR